jgi:hypothetical protein
MNIQKKFKVLIVVGCDTMQTHRYIPTFWRNMPSPFSGLKMAVLPMKPKL